MVCGCFGVDATWQVYSAEFPGRRDAAGKVVRKYEQLLAYLTEKAQRAGRTVERAELDFGGLNIVLFTR